MVWPLAAGSCGRTTCLHTRAQWPAAKLHLHSDRRSRFAYVWSTTLIMALDAILDIIRPRLTFRCSVVDMDSIQYQPAIQKHFAEEGTFFSKHYCTISICCPSRVSLLTGKAAHNTNVTDVSPPYGTVFSYAVANHADNLYQADTRSLSLKAGTMTTFPFGYRMLATTPTTPANS